MDGEGPVVLLLGPVDVRSSSGSDAGVSPGKQRAVLAYLVLREGRATSTRQIVDGVWSAPPPATATAMVHTAVARIRAAFTGRLTLETTPAGYVLRIDAWLVDIGRVRRLRELASAAAAAGRTDDAAALLRAALDTWRGDSLADLVDEPFADQARADLDRLRGQIQLDWAEQCVVAGTQLEDVIAALSSRLAIDPLDERARALVIEALRRTGRRAEALAQFDMARRALAAELGVGPGSELAALHGQMLEETRLDRAAQAGRADTDPGPRRWPAPRRGRRSRLTGALVLTIAAAIVVAVETGLAVGGGHHAHASLPTALSPTPPASPTVALSPAPITETLTLPEPSRCAITANGVWGAGHHDDRLYRFSGPGHRAVRTWPVLGYQSGLPVAAAGSIWVPGAAGDLVRFDPTSQRVVARIPTGGGAQVAFGFLDMWETTRDHQLLQIDLARNRVVASIRYDSGANDWDDPITVGPAAIWVSDTDANTLLRIDPTTRRITARIHGFGTTDSAMPLAYGAGSVWVKKIDGDRETLFQIDPATNLIVHAVDVAARGASGLTGAVTVGAGYIWTGNWDNTFTQIDPSTTRIMRRYALPSPPQNLEYGDGALWIDSYDANTAWKISVP